VAVVATGRYTPPGLLDWDAHDASAGIAVERYREALKKAVEE
jgi:hypothetical protein